MHGREDAIHADERQIKVDLSQRFIHQASGNFGEPIKSAREHAEDGRHSHDHVEVSHHKISIVEVQIQSGLAQEDSADSAGDEQGNESHREHHRRGKPDSSAPQRADPIKCLDGRRHANGHGERGKSHCRIGAHTAHKHVMAPDEEAQESNGQDGVNHGAVSENRLAREGREQLRRHPHAG